MENKFLGKWWNDGNCEIYEIDGRNIVINYYKFNGEVYDNCWEVDETLRNIITKGITVRPIYEEVEEEQYELIKYEIE